MTDPLQQFIVSQGWFDLIKFDNVIVYQCEFAKEHFQQSLFTELGVTYSDTLDRAVDKRKAEFLAGRFCANKVLAEFNVSDFQIVPDQNRAPVWPPGFNGSITHSNHNALVALSNSDDILGIGIDIESIMSDKTMADVKDAIVKGQEHDWLTQGTVSAGTVVSLIFSIKESFFKAAYPSTGYYFDFDAVTITELDYELGQFSLTVNQDLNAQIRPGQSYCGRFVLLDEQVLSLMVLNKG